MNRCVCVRTCICVCVYILVVYSNVIVDSMQWLLQTDIKQTAYLDNDMYILNLDGIIMLYSTDDEVHYQKTCSIYINIYQT